MVLMLPQLNARSDVMTGPRTVYNAGIECEYRDAEYKYDEDKKPEPNCCTETAGVTRF